MRRERCRPIWKGPTREDRLIRNLLGRVAVVAIVLGMTVAAPMTVAAAAPTTHSASNGDPCGYLDDGSGNGSAISLLPNETPAGGEQFFQENAGAWQVCYNSNLLQLTLKAYQGTWCIADNNNYAKLRACNGDTDQQWIMGGEVVFSQTGSGNSALCAGGGVGSEDLVLVGLANCSAYHSDWLFESTP
jgi:hypothetical protein